MSAWCSLYSTSLFVQFAHDQKPLKYNHNCNHVVYDSSGIDDSEEDEEDLPVQGPLPQEPEDGPWKKNESGIRKL